MSLIKSSVQVNPALEAEFAQALQGVKKDVDALLLAAAQDVGFEARRTSEFKDKTGKLRNSIKLEKSKFEDGGWLVTARAPHAHLVEFGHVLVRKTKSGIVKVIGHVSAHPFLRPALDNAKRVLIAKLKAGAANG